MKKRFLVLILLAALLLTAVPVGAYAARTLSPAVACLSRDVTLIKSGTLGKSISFSQADFKQALGVSRFESITVTALPASEEGKLTFSGSDVRVGQTVSFSSVYLLKFVPASSEVQSASFTFTAGNLAGGADIECKLLFTERENYAPTVLTAAAESLAVKTRSGITFFGSMSAADPEGDTLYFRVTAQPSHGTLTVTDRATGSYRYAPHNGYTGTDSFRYAVRDEYGNWSGEAEVTVKVEEAATSYVYADMTEHPAAPAAMEMTVRNMMCGTLSGDEMLFEPYGTVSRGDFVVMAMKAVGVAPIFDLAETCFDDNEAIPSAVRPYVATAQRYGIVHGSFEEDGLCFRADSPITKAEAAVILCRLLDAEAANASTTFNDGASIPIWAKSSVTALYELGIYELKDGNTCAAETITRADAAEMLYRTIGYCES